MSGAPTAAPPPQVAVADEWPELSAGTEGLRGPWRIGILRVRELQLHYDAVSSLCWMDERMLLTGSWDTSVKVSDLQRPAGDETIRSWGGHSGAVRAVAHCTATGVCLSGGQDCTVRMWSLEKGALGRIYVFSPLHALDMAGSEALTGLQDASVKLWDIERSQFALRLGTHADTVTTVQYTANNASADTTLRATALSGSLDGTATLWDRRSPLKACTRFVLGPPVVSARTRSVGAASASREVITADAAGEVCVWDVRSCAEPMQRTSPHAADCIAKALVVSAAGTTLSVGGRARGAAGFVSVVDTGTGAVHHSFMTTAPPLCSIDVREEVAAAGCRDGRAFAYEPLPGDALSPQPAAIEGALLRAEKPLMRQCASALPGKRPSSASCRSAARAFESHAAAAICNLPSKPRLSQEDEAWRVATAKTTLAGLGEAEPDEGALSDIESRQKACRCPVLLSLGAVVLAASFVSSFLAAPFPWTSLHEGAHAPQDL